MAPGTEFLSASHVLLTYLRTTYYPFRRLLLNKVLSPSQTLPHYWRSARAHPFLTLGPCVLVVGCCVPDHLRPTILVGTERPIIGVNPLNSREKQQAQAILVLWMR